MKLDPPASIVVRPWAETHQFAPYMAFPPITWVEEFVWAGVDDGRKRTFSYYTDQGPYGKREWVVLWPVCMSVPVQVWRVLGAPMENI